MTEHGVIRSDRVFEAMLATDRGIYSKDYPYEDSPQSIGVFSSVNNSTSTQITNGLAGERTQNTFLNINACRFLLSSKGTKPPSVLLIW